MYCKGIIHMRRVDLGLEKKLKESPFNGEVIRCRGLCEDTKVQKGEVATRGIYKKIWDSFQCVGINCVHKKTSGITLDDQ